MRRILTFRRADRAQKEILDQINEAKETQKAMQASQDQMENRVQAQIQELGQKFDSLKDILERYLLKGHQPPDSTPSYNHERDRSEENSKRTRTNLMIS